MPRGALVCFFFLNSPGGLKIFQSVQDDIRCIALYIRVGYYWLQIRFIVEMCYRHFCGFYRAWYQHEFWIIPISTLGMSQRFVDNFCSLLLKMYTFEHFLVEDWCCLNDLWFLFAGGLSMAVSNSLTCQSNGGIMSENFFQKSNE